MITYYIWKKWSNEFSEEIFDILSNIIFSIFTIPIDIVLCPLEIISIIIYFLKRHIENR